MEDAMKTVVLSFIFLSLISVFLSTPAIGQPPPPPPDEPLPCPPHCPPPEPPIVQPPIHPTGQVRVTVNVLNVRSGPGMTYRRMYKVYLGDILLINDKYPGWFYVKLPFGCHGWVVERLTSPVFVP